MATNRTVTVKASGGTYSSLSDALATESKGLVALDRQLTIECYDLDDAIAPVTVTGFTTSATCYLKIVGAATARHGGLFTTDGYTLATTGSGGASLVISSPYVWVDGIRINNGSNTYGVYVFYADGPVYLSNLVIKNGATALRLGAQNVSTPVAAWNLIAYDLAGAWAVDNGSAYCTLYLSNGTFVDVSNGVATQGGTTYARNVAVKSTYESFYQVSGTLQTAYCASSDALADDYGASGAQINVADFGFVDAGNDNYLLAAGSPLFEAGTDLSADPNYRPVSPVDDDITDTTRAGNWDIGADEYIVSPPVVPLAFWAYVG